MTWNRDNPSKFDTAAVAWPKMQENFIFMKDILANITGYTIGATHAYGLYIDATVGAAAEASSASYGDGAASYCIMPKPLPLASSPTAANFITGQFYYDTTIKNYQYCDSTVWNYSYPLTASVIATPATSTDNVVARWNGDSGATIQTSKVPLNDSGEFQSSNLIALNKEIVLSKIHDCITDYRTIKGMYFFDKCGTETYLSDRTPFARHTAHNANLLLGSNPLQAANYTPTVNGIARSMLFTNSKYSIPNHTDFSFGNGTTDSPFSIIVLFNPSLIGLQYFVIKNSEYDFVMYANGYSYLFLRSNNNSAVYMYAASIDHSSDVGTWHVYIVTYDGSAANTGMKIYHDGVYDNGGRNTVGTYVAMNPSSSAIYNSTSVGQRLGFLSVVGEELSYTQVKRISKILLSYVGSDI